MLASLKRFLFAIFPWVLLLAALGGVYVWWGQRNEASMAEHTVYLILPDGQDPTIPAVSIWLDAAREEGIPMRAISDSDFLRRPEASDQRSAAILPDLLHRQITPVMVSRLEQFASRGGQLLIVYDGGILASGDIPAGGVSPLSNLVGVRYGPDRERFGVAGVERGPLLTTAAGIHMLQLPPGKTMEMSSPPAEALLRGKTQAITGYQYGALLYPILPTSGTYKGEILIASESGGVAAGYRQVGKGGVLFVNTPIGYLKGQTDGTLLHTFMRHLVVDRLGLPVLKATADGIGGLIFNWHVDSNASIPQFERLESFGAMQQGPYSIHFTAGPDVNTPGDGLGLDLESNASARKWAVRFRDRGDALGDHGGWIHNYFGEHVGDGNRDEMIRYLELNEKAVSSITERPSREYSAPMGNQPEWVTDWLEAHGMVAYYFTGNTGMGPTRSYRDGRLKAQRIWSFPVLTLGRLAAFEEFDEENLSDDLVKDWLTAAASYAADTGSLRTIYSHPHGFYHFPEALRSLFAHTRKLSAAGRFRWTTMSSAADFLNRREQTIWSYTGTDEQLTLKASHPSDLGGLAWEVPKVGNLQPRITAGEGRVEDIGRAWRVVAGPGLRFEFEFTRRALL